MSIHEIFMNNLINLLLYRYRKYTDDKICKFNLQHLQWTLLFFLFLNTTSNVYVCKSQSYFTSLFSVLLDPVLSLVTGQLPPLN